MHTDSEIEYYLNVAALTAQRSKARRLKVGAVLVSSERIMGIGYNGTPSGWDNNCEVENDDGSLTTKKETIHAELNALFKFLNNGISANDSSMFLTHAPCMECAKALVLARVKRIYYLDEYRSPEGVEFLRESGLVVVNIKKKADAVNQHQLP